MALIELKGGLIVDDESIRLAIALETSGHLLSATDGVLTVTNGSTLTSEQRQQITRQKRHVCAIAAYQPPEVP